MNRLKTSQIVKSCILGIICGAVFGLVYGLIKNELTKDVSFIEMITNGFSFGLAMTTLDLIRSSKLNRWYYLVALAVWIVALICLQWLSCFIDPHNIPRR